LNAARESASPRSISVVVPEYRDADRAISLVHAMHRQVLPAGAALQVIVVDDASPDGSLGQLEDALSGLATVIGMPANAGRSATRNAGAAAACGERVVFVDCDCLPAETDFVVAHLAAWERGTVASAGPVMGSGGGDFWDRYQSAASERRAGQHAKGATFSGSSQNMMVDRTAFMRCGGFDTGFQHYGFEDRDLLLRLGRHGAVAWASRAAVRHMDELNLVTVCRKMGEAGEKSAALFRDRYPSAYRSLGYAALDVHQRRWLLGGAWLLEPVLEASARASDRIIRSRMVPYRLKFLLARILTAAGYLVGTARARRNEARA
jgi:glycosyltransferase involved in cell wall biosynthesis